MINKLKDCPIEKRKVGGGENELEFHHRFTPEETFGKCRICSEITIQPGEFIGLHPHQVEIEFYYMLDGELVSIGEDGSEEPFRLHDMMVTGGGEKHAVRNDSSAPATILAIVIN